MFERKIFKRNYKELTGCIHNHTNHSYDCDIPVENLISAAKKNKLDYVTINDHLDNSVKNDNAVKNEKQLSIICGFEVNDTFNNHHYLVFNSNDIIKGKTASEYVEFYNKTGAVGFIAHPFEKRSSRHFRKYLWTDENIKGVNGVEIWNYASTWLGKLNPYLNGLLLIFFPHIFIRKALKKNIRFWESLLDKGEKVSAIGSTDAHSTQVSCPIMSFRILKHAKLFASIRTNILIPENEEINNQTILNAIDNGNSYIVNYILGYPYNFYAGICGKDGIGVTFGETIKLTENMKFYYNLPKICKVKLIKNGKRIKTEVNEKGGFLIDSPGRYRLEIQRFHYRWIYTNYIFVNEN